MLAHGLRQHGIAGAGIGKDDVQNLLAGACSGNLVKQAGLLLTRPRPWAYFPQAALIDIDDNDAALGLPISSLAPDQIASAFLDLVKRVTGEHHQTGPCQGRQRHT